MRIHICIFMYIYTYVCIYTHVYLCVHMCAHVYMQRTHVPQNDHVCHRESNLKSTSRPASSCAHMSKRGAVCFIAFYCVAVSQSASCKVLQLWRSFISHIRSDLFFPLSLHFRACFNSCCPFPSLYLVISVSLSLISTHTGPHSVQSKETENTQLQSTRTARYIARHRALCIECVSTHKARYTAR